MRRLWWSVLLTQRHWHSRSCDIKGFRGCILLGAAASHYSIYKMCVFRMEVKVGVICCSLPSQWKVKWSRYRPGVAQRVGRGIALLFHDRDTRRGWVVSSTPRPRLTPGKDPVPILQEAGWAENLVPTGIRSWTVQPVISRYTDWATGPTPPLTVHGIIQKTSVQIFFW